MSTKIIKPEGWTIIKIEQAGGPPLFKIFGTWRWEGEKWVLSSGSIKPEDIHVHKEYFEWKQNSGRTYQLTLRGENCMTMWQSMKLDLILGDSEKNKRKSTTVKIEELLLPKYTNKSDNQDINL
jgi:hypothetical protein